MEDSILTSVKSSIKHWYLLLILGIVLILVGIWVFNTPVASYVTLSILFALTFLFTGIIELSYAIGNQKTSENWGWNLIGGIIDVVIGMMLLSQPQISMIILPLYVGFAILFRSIMAIGWSIDLKKRSVKSWSNLLIIGILGVIFALIMLWNPVFAGMTIVFYTAFAFILIGVFQVFLSFKLKNLRSI